MRWRRGCQESELEKWVLIDADGHVVERGTAVPCQIVRYVTTDSGDRLPQSFRFENKTLEGERVYRQVRG